MVKFLDLSGQKFGRWTARKRGPNRAGQVHWICDCACGNTVLVRTDNLTSGKSRSCGCSRKQTIAGTLSRVFTQDISQLQMTAIDCLSDLKWEGYSVFDWCAALLADYIEVYKAIKKGKRIPDLLNNLLCDKYNRLMEARL